MALNVGPDFKQRWLQVPEAVRQAYLEDFKRISDLLKPETSLDDWIAHDDEQQQYSLDKIATAYAELKAHLIQEAKIRHQRILEQKLAQKRAEQAAYAAQLQQDEVIKFAKETEKLTQLRQNLDQEICQYTARYQQNPEQTTTANQATQLLSQAEIQTQRENLKIRLELEADTLIEQAVTIFRAKLHSAAQEEIEYILKSADQIIDTSNENHQS
ncbi:MULTISPECIES: hypothetical protein [unclassified Acinetobacter]|uniref:cell division protein BlhA n=1 Tax=unclassified Acinetobacter TaxID=196816 RepID=UPI00293448A3|nr:MULTISPECIES: hypothetical protein [unclassified Acinetobacter]WOE30679.1 hypothetical protein QSG84_09870 [Acinetobacter sp. SAAs470]WOE38872.1 hypothetical protein QSG86_03535 [Acinetobacter sp. SAAs474]